MPVEDLKDQEFRDQALSELPAMSITDILRISTRDHPNQVSIRYRGYDLTYSQLDELSTRLAISLIRLGAKKGDRVALLLPNIPQFPISFFAILKIGGIVVPLNVLFKVRELRKLLIDSEAEFVISCSDIIQGVDYFKSLSECRGQLSLKEIITTSVIDYLPTLGRLLAPIVGLRKRRPPRTLDLRDLIHSSDGTKVPQIVVSPSHDTAVLQYSSGTTGLPKAAMLSHENIVSQTEIVSKWIMTRESQEVGLIVLPLFHVFGLASMLVVLRSAGRVVLLPRFDRKVVLRTIEKERATLFPGVPAMFSSLLSYEDLGEYDLSSLRACFAGATSLPPGIARDFAESTGSPLVELYGLSEVSGAAVFNPLDGTARVGSVGLPLPTIQIEILDLEDSRALPPGEVGEIAIKGPTVMTGYWHDRNRAVDEDGWLRTGDLGKTDHDGYLYFLDRKKDLINVSGYKVFPKEVEDVIAEHQSVEDVAVVGSKDEAMNEVVIAFVSLKNGAKVSAPDLVEFCRERIIHYKVPKRIEIRKDLPKSIIGKVIKSSLK